MGEPRNSFVEAEVVVLDPGEVAKVDFDFTREKVVRIWFLGITEADYTTYEIYKDGNRIWNKPVPIDPPDSPHPTWRYPKEMRVLTVILRRDAGAPSPQRYVIKIKGEWEWRERVGGR